MTRYFRWAYEELEPAFQGLDTDTAEYAMAKFKAPVIQNLLCDRPGTLIMRGPLHAGCYVPGLAITHSGISGWLSWGNLVYVGFRAVSVASPAREPWVAPYRPVTNAANLLNIASPMLAIQDLTTTGSGSAQTTIPPTSTDIPRFGATQLNGTTYAMSYGWVSTHTQTNGNVHPLCSICYLTSTGTLSTLPNCPDGGMAVRAHLGRLFCLGGRNVPGGAPADILFNTLFWTDPTQNPVTGGATAWKDAVSGLVNQIVVDVDNPDDFGVALAKVGSNLAVFKRHSIHLLTGYSSTTFKVSPFTFEQGCLDARSIVEHDSGVFFLSQQGFMFFDGRKLTNLSANLKSSLLLGALNAVGDNGLDGGYAMAQLLDNNYILLSIGNQTVNASTSNVGVNFCGLYSISANAWSTFISFTSQWQVPVGFCRSAHSGPFMVDGDGSTTVAFTKLDALTVPEVVAGSLRGFDTNPVTGVSKGIPVVYKSRITPLGSPIHHAQVHRFMQGYIFRQNGVTDAAAVPGMTVSAGSSDGTSIASISGVPGMGTIATSYPYRRQVTLDSFCEATDGQVGISWTANSNPPAIADFQIHESAFEFYPSHEQRNE